MTEAGPSENVATYVGHGTLRIAVMGFENRPASGEESDRMKGLLEEAFQAGAIGLSLGLMYAPGSYTPREELAELCSVLSRYGGLLATHIRGEGNSLIPLYRRGHLDRREVRGPTPDQPPQGGRRRQLGQCNDSHGTHRESEVQRSRRHLRRISLHRRVYRRVYLADDTAPALGSRRRRLPDPGEVGRSCFQGEDQSRVASGAR